MRAQVMREPLGMVEGVREQLARALGRGVGRDRVQHRIVLAERPALALAVHGRRGREDDARPPRARRRLEHRGRAVHVHVGVDGGPLEARAHAGERRQVDDAIDPAGSKARASAAGSRMSPRTSRKRAWSSADARLRRLASSG